MPILAILPILLDGQMGRDGLIREPIQAIDQEQRL